MHSRETPEIEYSAPEVKDLGTLSEQTLLVVNKTGNVGDVIVLNGQNIPVPGSQVAP
jgi:hypothetical protein